MAITLAIYQDGKFVASKSIVATLDVFPSNARKNPGGWVDPIVSKTIEELSHIPDITHEKSWTIYCTQFDKIDDSGRVYRTKTLSTGEYIKIAEKKGK